MTTFQAPPALRLRRFLHGQGIRLKPWASPHEVLESFYDQLAQPGHDEVFWSSLSDLARVLVEDLRARRPSSGLFAELVADVPALVGAIREALTQSRSGGGGYRNLKALLGFSPMALLLIVTVTAVGCGGEVGGSGQDESAGGSGQSGTDAGGTGGSATGGRAEVAIDLGVGGGVPSEPYVGLAGAAPCATGTTMEELLSACGVDEPYRSAYLDALEASAEGWKEAIASYFSCSVCRDLVGYFEGCFGTQGTASPYQGDIYEVCPPVPVYLGVRFT